ncbi:MAG: NADH-quinone oxidoreductase subunit N [Elusimicrobiota bacterium]
MSNLQLLLPETILAGLALGIAALDILLPPRRARLLYHCAWIAAASVLIWLISSLGWASSYGVGTLWACDPFSQFFKIIILLTSVLCLLLGLDYVPLPEKHAGTFSALVLFSSAGLMCLVSATDMLMIFVSLELVSISSFILTGFERNNPKSTEGSMKYFLFGAFSSAIMVYGISLYYGATGGTHLLPNAAGHPMLTLGLILILLGFGFKASLAPMHFWVPDAYEGAPTPVAAFLSVAPKLATFAAIARIFGSIFTLSAYDLGGIFTLLAVLTMTIGNLTALFQTDVKRLLAYSSIAQAGYLLIGLAVGTPLGLEGVMFYSFVYIAMNIGAFAVAQAVGSAKNSYDLSAFDGLSKNHLGLSLCLTFCLLSLAGIPPFAGFMGKLYIFSAAVESGRWGLAVAGVLNSVVSVYYYFLIAHRMFFREPSDERGLCVGPYVYGGLAVAVIGVLLLGLHPEPLIAGVRASTGMLP